MPISRVFISHSSKDKPFASSVVEALRRHPDIKPWIGSEQIPPGSGILGRLGRELDSMDFLVFLISKAALESEWVKREVDYAVNREMSEKREIVLPFIIDNTKVAELLWPLRCKNVPAIHADSSGADFVASSARQAIERRWDLEKILQEYLRRIQDKIVRRYAPLKERLFHLHLYALPIKCQKSASPDQTIRFENLLDQQHRLFLLIGLPGCGKTTACHRLTANPPQPLIPVNIREILPCAKKDVLEFFARDAGIDDLRSLESIERAGRLLFIADGIGEKGRVVRVVESLRLLAQDLPHSKFIVTCRTGDYKQSWFPDFQRWDILELDARAQNNFLKTQKNELKQRVSQGFRTNPELRKLCHNQFLFLLVIRLMAKDEGIVTVPTRVAAYEYFLKDFLRRWEKLQPGETHFIVNCLKELAVEMRKSSEDRTWLADDKIREVLSNYLKSKDVQYIKDHLNDLYHTGLIEQVNGGVRFFQETFQEYLCAKWMIDQVGFSINDVILSFYNELTGFK